MDIGHNLDKHMRAAGFRTQAALSLRSGVPQGTISRILKGGNGPSASNGKQGPGTATLIKLAAACNVTLAELTKVNNNKNQHDLENCANMGLPDANYVPSRAALIKLIKSLDTDQLKTAWDVLGYFVHIKRDAKDAVISNLVSGDPPIRERHNGSRKARGLPPAS